MTSQIFLLSCTLLLLPGLAGAQTGVGSLDAGKPASFGAPGPGDRNPGTQPQSYAIAVGDLLNVYVMDVPEISRDYRVSPGGMIDLPLLQQPIKAEGLSLNQLSGVISGRLQKAEMVSHPHIVVSVKSSNAHTIAITGAVRKPQVYPVFGPTTLLDALSQAEGLSDDAGGTALITRGETAAWALKPAETPQTSRLTPATAPTVKVDLRKLLETGDSSLNLTLYPGDKVTVQRAGIVYVVGAVNRPGGFPLKSEREEMTVLQAVALGEGLTSTALRKKAVIIRKGSQFPGGRDEVAVNLADILAGHAPDRELKPNDILFVPDSTTKKMLRRGAEAAVQTATGVIIWRR